MSHHLVWFKRDLRVHDHAQLLHASRNGPVLCLFIIEPSLWRQPMPPRNTISFYAKACLIWMLPCANAAAVCVLKSVRQWTCWNGFGKNPHSRLCIRTRKPATGRAFSAIWRYNACAGRIA
ncbi:MAG: hypothetical protein CTY19_10420 [Methylomonas sp.]|nr:MAG: hypothetical protein CTY19_10420 [Methylomonas sp.]